MHTSRKAVFALLTLALVACGPKSTTAPDAPDAATDAATTPDVLEGCEALGEGAGCDDGDLCTANDTCQGGICAGEPISCDDGDPCTEGACTPGVGCVQTALAGPCDDGDLCTEGDSCQAGDCVGEAYTCDDGDPCTADQCDGDGGCTFPEGDGTCDDGDPCTVGDTCQGGTCAGEPNPCDDGEVCTFDQCVTPLGCVHQPVSAQCDDGDACTVGDHCQDGACVGTQAADCDLPTCGDGVCQPAESCQSCPGDCNPAGLGDCAGACDPTTTSGCPDNHACVPTIDGVLNILPFVGGNGRCGTPCDVQGDCEGGVCVAVEGLDSQGLCMTSCDPSAEDGCEGGLGCVALAVGGAQGICSHWELCDPAADAPCGQAPGGTCLPLSDAPDSGLCRPVCWAAWPETCFGVFGDCVPLGDPMLHEGTCIGQPVPCDVATQEGCSTGETCAPVIDVAIGGVARVCGEAQGSAGEGQPCGADGCAPGLLCVDALCHAPCTPAEGGAAPCEVGVCEVPSAWAAGLGESVGVCRHLCGDGACTLDEDCAGCEADCGACTSCGDGVCDPGEHCVDCAIDCGACPLCGDGLCQSFEDCAGCEADCGGCVCGDGLCQGDEVCGGCAADCPECACGDGECVTGESCSGCPSDCGVCACGDGVCSPDEGCEGCPEDCGLCWCGDGQCTGLEGCANCALDCGGCVCGDGACQVVETCMSCAADCGECVVNCGDGVCGHLESCGSCEVDCGACVADCGDGVCTAAESCGTCALDCCPDCGDGLCQAGEDCTICPSDCAIDAPGSCHGSCDPTEGALACAGNYTCMPTRSGGRYVAPAVAGHGVCLPQPCEDGGECPLGHCLKLDGLESAGTCGTLCDPAAESPCGQWEVCVASTVSPGEGLCLPDVACSSGSAVHCPVLGASACVGLTELDGGACMAGCFVDDPNPCGGAGTCVLKTSPEWHEGTCVGQPIACDPIGQTGCTPTETCIAMGGAELGGVSYLCAEATGAAPAGSECDAAMGCAPGLTCAYGTCMAYCDPELGCEGGTCAPIGGLLFIDDDALGLCQAAPVAP